MCCVWWLSRVWLFVTPWTVPHQAPLSLEFSRQEHQSGVSFPSWRREGFSQPRDWTWVSWIAGQFFTIWTTKEVPIKHDMATKKKCHSTVWQWMQIPWHWCKECIFLIYFFFLSKDNCFTELHCFLSNIIKNKKMPVGWQTAEWSERSVVHVETALISNPLSFLLLDTYFVIVCFSHWRKKLGGEIVADSVDKWLS